MITEEQPQVDLEKVYNYLIDAPFFQSKEKTKVLNQFAELLARKSSFAHKVHKKFNSLGNFPDDRS